MRARLLTLVLAAALLAGCGGDDKGYGDPISIDQATQTQLSGLVSSAASVSKVESTPCQGTDLAQMVGVYSSLNVLLQVKLGAHNGSSATVIGEIVRGALAARAKPLRPDGTCLPGSGSVTFDNFTFEGGSLSGTISYSAGRFQADLTVTLTGAGSSATMKMKADLSISDTAVKGTMSVTASASVGGSAVQSSFSASYDVRLSDGCATAGTIEVHASGSASSAQAHADYDLWAKAEFGPACGDVTVY